MLSGRFCGLGDALSTGARLGHAVTCCAEGDVPDPEIAALSDRISRLETNSPPRKRLTIPRFRRSNYGLLIVLTYVALAWAVFKIFRIR